MVTTTLNIVMPVVAFLCGLCIIDATTKYFEKTFGKSAWNWFTALLLMVLYTCGTIMMSQVILR